MIPDTDFARLVSNWASPPELGGSPPRPVKLTGTGTALNVLALVMLVGGVLLGIKLSNDAAAQSQTARLLKEQGAETQATVIRLWRGGGKDRPYRLTYQFEVQGRVFHRDSGASRRIWESLTEGSPLRVRYLPADPKLSHPADWESQQIPAWVPLMVPAAFASYTLIIILMLRKQRRLLEDGRAAPAVIYKVSATKGGKSVRYNFRSQAGTLEKGSGLMARGLAQNGSVVTIIYDPEKPSRNAPYPFKMVRPVVG
jgi:hypothetical protein